MSLSFNDVAGGQGFCQEIDTICKTNTTQYPLVQKARRMNNALDVYFQKSMVWCGNWSVGDWNNTTDLSDATTTTTGVQDYRLNIAMLVLESLWYKKSGDTEYTELTSSTEPFANPGTTAAVPKKYTMRENSIILDTIPPTGTLRIFYRRVLPRFVSTDTTKTSGAPAIHDFYLARLAALPYLIENAVPTKNDIAAAIAQDEIMARDYYDFRNRGARPGRLTRANQDNR